LNVCVPPQGVDTVNVPVDGGFTKDSEPFTEYRSFEHADGVADSDEIEQIQDAGAV
jgi:hypothetical protein